MPGGGRGGDPRPSGGDSGGRGRGGGRGGRGTPITSGEDYRAVAPPSSYGASGIPATQPPALQRRTGLLFESYVVRACSQARQLAATSRPSRMPRPRRANLCARRLGLCTRCPQARRPPPATTPKAKAKAGAAVAEAVVEAGAATAGAAVAGTADGAAPLHAVRKARVRQPRQPPPPHRTAPCPSPQAPPSRRSRPPNTAVGVGVGVRAAHPLPHRGAPSGSASPSTGTPPSPPPRCRLVGPPLLPSLLPPCAIRQVTVVLLSLSLSLGR